MPCLVSTASKQILIENVILLNQCLKMNEMKRICHPRSTGLLLQCIRSKCDINSMLGLAGNTKYNHSRESVLVVSQDASECSDSSAFLITY
jgi:hypothetical protein